jgi:general secretion pathway protein D
MIDAAQSVLTDKRSKVLTDSRTSQLVVVATDPEQQAVDTLINQLDKPTRQVLIETRLVEITTNPKTKKGIDWTGTLQGQNVTFGNTLSGGVRYNTTGGFTPATGFLSADGLSVVMSFLNASSEAQIMSTPRIVTLDNEAANISVTKGIPIFTVAAGTQNTAGGSSVSYSNVGTILHVTPRISANNSIWLKVVPEVSSQIGQGTQAISDGAGGSTTLTAPIFQYRTMDTHVLIPNSNTLVLGGLVEDSPKAEYTKVPMLGDIPGLGKLFSSETKEVNKVNLLIFITPTIVKDTDFQTSKSGEYLMNKPQIMKDPLNPKTAWDGAQPNGTWSNPITPNAE